MKKRNIVLMLFILITVFIAVAVIVGGVSSAKTVVCIDAGHGGDDVGAINGNRLEKDDNLRLALEVEKELKDRGVKVVMTRSGDETVSLESRCEIANRKKADLFVALHRNSADSGNGVEIWVSSDKPTEDILLAESILKELDTVGISRNRGVRSGLQSNQSSDYYVNKYTAMPSCLVEVGFITNENDNTLFDDNLKSYAKAVADGIMNALNSDAQPE